MCHLFATIAQFAVASVCFQLFFFVVCTEFSDEISLFPPVLYCHRCLSIFGDRSSLEYHQQIAHFEERAKAKVYACEYSKCGRLFSQPWQLKNHQIKCHNANRFQCNFCQKGFKEKRKLIYHQRIHTNERSEVCKFCKLTFTDPSTLRQHVNNVHGDNFKPFLCKKCGKRFAKMSVLQSHWKTHLVPVEDRKKYQCDFCDSKFTMKWNKNKHERKYHHAVV